MRSERKTPYKRLTCVLKQMKGSRWARKKKLQYARGTLAGMIK